MREILFRGKRKDIGVWMVGNLIHQLDYYGTPCDRYFMTGKHDCVDYDIGEPIEVIPETVGQYTGLDPALVQDEKLVFEGDIVKITDHTIEETFESCEALVTLTQCLMLMTRTYEVFWNVTKWSIKSLEPMLAIDPPIFDLPTKNVTYEIISSIHDQKEDV